MPKLPNELHSYTIVVCEECNEILNDPRPKSLTSRDIFAAQIRYVCCAACANYLALQAEYARLNNERYDKLQNEINYDKLQNEINSDKDIALAAGVACGQACATSPRSPHKEVKTFTVGGTKEEVEKMSLFVHSICKERGPDQERLAQAGLDFITLLLKKNADYGNSAWTVPLLCPGLPVDTALRVRASDKINRIITLLQKPSEVKTETLVDTFRDLGAYCLLWIARPETPAVSSP